MMHLDYAKERFLEYETPKYAQPFTHQMLVEIFIEDSEFLKLVDNLDNEKLSSIAATVRASGNNRYAKVTPKQKYALASGLLGYYKTARAVYAAAYGVTEAEMFGDPVPIEISVTERVWFSDQRTACVVEVAENGEILSVTVSGNADKSRQMSVSDCYPASFRALANCKKYGIAPAIVTARVDGKIVVLAHNEAIEHGIKESGLRNVGAQWVPNF